ncbi:hypothetical protein DCCM_2482 [Desulfocucumis palustris]|uniref:Putative regulatory protein FmdB zinc ribbon domain-containing protein n=1 Tax=Desulfocucumis palustris TaxID=1898651 RepID=A0A2L2XHN1_9FIRM|nr:zinc ribbon domain-containing protein [Desulfocucumis palustris]GBF33381.1 hypothetical protein DCCM_2482 [Desulfocucumis palustris]
MPVYDFFCEECGARREVLVDYETKKRLELLCVKCGGVVKAAPVNMFGIIASKRAEQAGGREKVKPCGHTHHCRCASIKQTRPNPFQKQIDKALQGDNQQ